MSEIAGTGCKKSGLLSNFNVFNDLDFPAYVFKGVFLSIFSRQELASPVYTMP